MSHIVDPLAGQIASRVRAERERRNWTLTDLAEASGVSRAMINRIERGESSPTATVLGKLSGAFQLTISSLLAFAEQSPDPAAPDPAAAERGGPRRLTETPEWHDPDSGYRRLQISGPRFPASVADIRLPPGARVPYPAAAFAFTRHVIWVLEGRLTFHEGETVHELGAGDSLELGEPAACAYENTTDIECRYTVIVVRTPQA